MPELTFDALRRLILEAAGEDEGLTLDDSALDTTFDDLGYDSLAVLETISRIERAYGLALPEHEVSEARTPRALIAFVNERLSVAADQR
jgi:act minimal PKS acyl carrier protein